MVEAARNLITEHRSQELQDAARALASKHRKELSRLAGGGEKGGGGGIRRGSTRLWHILPV